MTTVLYIDEDQAYQRWLSKALASRTFNVVLAANGLEGVRKAHELRPDVILMDLPWPCMDSVEAVAELKGSRYTWHIPIIFMSNLPADLRRYPTSRRRSRDFLTKPFETDELIEIIHKMLP
jgi:CheY-like chemotaxis protein